MGDGLAGTSHNTTRHKETALGGLAATATAQKIAKRVLIRDIEMLPDEGGQGI